MVYMTATTAPTYRVKGTTDDTTTCERCGKPNLRGTVVLSVLDADGNEESVAYFGSDCAARVTGRKAQAIRDAAAAADRKLAGAMAVAREHLAVYGPVEGDLRATAEVFFTRNPHMRTRCRASEVVAEMLAAARKTLTDAALLGR